MYYLIQYNSINQYIMENYYLIIIIYFWWLLLRLSWRRGSRVWLWRFWVRSPLEGMNCYFWIFSLLRSGTKAKARRWIPPLNAQCLEKFGSACLNTRFPLPTQLCAEYSVKLIFFIYVSFPTFRRHLIRINLLINSCFLTYVGTHVNILWSKYIYYFNIISPKSFTRTIY